MRKTLPIVLHNPKILLIGGGKVAAQKAEVMARNAIVFDVVAVEANERVESTARSVQLKPFVLEDSEAYGIIIDATGNPEIAALLLEAKKRRDFLLNIVDVPEACDFFFAALIERGPLKIAVSSGGASPTLAQSVRDRIKTVIPEALGELAQELQAGRNAGIIDVSAAKAQTQKLLGRVSLVGCGPGDVDLLTMRAYRIIREADVFFIDHLLSAEILELIPKTALRLFVGKKKGHHYVKQERINELLIEYAAKGLHVARLKAGDPYIFGRGAEEALSLGRKGIPVDVVPGVTSALGAPLCAGIAPTARGISTSFSVVTAHLAGDRFHRGWIDLLSRPAHTTMVLMGLSRAAQIVEAALEAGVRADLPVAIVANASRSNQERVVTTLEHLADEAAKIDAPSVLIFGEVVTLSQELPQWLASEEEKINMTEKGYACL